MKIIGNPGALKPVISKLFNIRLSMTCADLEGFSNSVQCSKP